MVKYKYDAWGNVKTEVIDEAHALIAELNPFRYRSYYYDPETNLYYLNTRYYDPETGRFISQDDVSYLDPEHINGLNLFAYCGNNPVMGTDPNGTTQWWEWLIAGLIVAVLVAGAIAATVFTGGVFAAALTGAAIGAGVSLGFQAYSGELNWGKFALDIGVGAISGAIGASGISRVGSIIVGSLIGGTSDIASQLISGNTEIDWLSVGISAFIGGISGAISGPGAKNAVAMGKSIAKDSAVISAKKSMDKVGNKLINGLYATTRGARSAATQVMNKMAAAVQSAAKTYASTAIRNSLALYGISTFVTNIVAIFRG